jgi:hypothetical protein
MACEKCGLATTACRPGHVFNRCCAKTAFYALQELVFIGGGMDQSAIEAALDECLVSDEEFAKYNEHWAQLKDPEHAVTKAWCGHAALGCSLQGIEDPSLQLEGLKPND